MLCRISRRYALERIESWDPTLLSVECSQFHFPLSKGSSPGELRNRDKDKKVVGDQPASIE